MTVFVQSLPSIWLGIKQEINMPKFLYLQTQTIWIFCDEKNTSLSKAAMKYKNILIIMGNFKADKKIKD